MIPVVSADDVTKRWSTTQALSGATFAIGQGVTGLLGANGAGKTTLLGLILGLHRPDSGVMTVFGQDPWLAGAAVRALLGYAPEHDAFPPDVAAHDVVRHLAELHGLPRRQATARASDALWEVGLGEERFRPVGTMSTGQRQRVKLAQAIAHDPELLLLDEPTNGLDPSQREDMLALIEHVGADLGMNVIVSSHLLEEVERVSSAVVILEGGRVVAEGNLAELRRTDPGLIVELDHLDGFDPAAALVSALAQSGLDATADGSRRCRRHHHQRIGLRHRPRRIGRWRVLGKEARAPDRQSGGHISRHRRAPGMSSDGELDVVASDEQARIFEAGYRPYRGVRLGVSHSVWTLARHTTERIMGIKRPARYKVLPFATVAIAYLPAIAFIGIVALLPNGVNRVFRIIPAPGRYYSFITAAILLFTAFAAPEALCPDKRSRFLGVYLASPLNRSTYLLSKAIAVVGVLLLVTLGPPLLLLIGLSLQNDGPRGFGNFVGTAAQIIVAGVVLSLMFGAISLAIPSLTDRRAFASAGTVLLIIGSGAVTNVLVFGLGGPNYLLALALDRLPFDLALRIFTLQGLPTRTGPPLSNAPVIAAAVLITVVAAGLAWWRIVHTEVTR